MTDDNQVVPNATQPEEATDTETSNTPDAPAEGVRGAEEQKEA